MLKIESDIPMPEPSESFGSGRTKYDSIRKTIFAMKPGQCVTFRDYNEATKFRSRAAGMKKSMKGFDKEFALRTIRDKDGNPECYRVWRGE